MRRFEGSFLGDASRIGDGTSLECGVCWWRYDPAVGDDVWQIPPGTPFVELPEHWRCPNCDAAQHQFMVVQHGASSRPDDVEQPETSAGSRALAELEATLCQAYAGVGDRMQSLPVYNHQLAVEVIGLRRREEGTIGVIITPWCMNLILVPGPDARPRVEGSKRSVAFPSGSYEFIAGHLDVVGPIESCSLFSPMNGFDEQEFVRKVAQHALDAVFESPEKDTSAPADPGRRRFLRAGLQ